MSEVKKLKTRDEMDDKYKWAIGDLYSTDQEWQTDANKLDEYIPSLASYKGRLSESAKVLMDYLNLFWKTSNLAEKVYVYANQKLHEDLANTKYQSFASKAQNILVNLSGTVSFFEPEILQMSEEKINSFIGEGVGLEKYKKIFDDILRKKDHILNQEIEEVLAKAGDISTAPSDIFSLFNNADLKFPDIKDENGHLAELTHGRYISFMESHDREVRKEAFTAMYSSYNSFKNTLAATYAASVKKDVFFSKMRKYSSSMEAELNDSNIPVSVYNNLISTVNKKLSLLHKYVQVRKEALDIDEIHMYDLYAPMVKDVNKNIPYEEAKEIVKEGLAPMGEDYLTVLQKGYDEGWIDVYENKGKRSGAYSWGAYGVHPYVLLNYQNNLNNVFTLAHEMGHALHSYYSDKTQPYPLAGYKIFVAEVASTCNESLLIHYLLGKTEDKKEKAYLINYFLEQFRGTLFRQTMFAEFEKTAHEIVESGEALTEENLCKLYYNLNKKYFGNDIVVDEDIAIEWARIPHFYTPFYVYQYSTGFSAAMALSKRIMEEGEPAVRDYMRFLTGGGSKDPIDLLKLAGVDMSKEEPIIEALEIFEDLLDKFQSL